MTADIQNIPESEHIRRVQVQDQDSNKTKIKCYKKIVRRGYKCFIFLVENMPLFIWKIQVAKTVLEHIVNNK